MSGVHVTRPERRHVVSGLVAVATTWTIVSTMLFVTAEGQGVARAPLAGVKARQIALNATEVLLSDHPHHLPVSGRRLIRSKVMDTRTLHIREVVTEATTGRELSFEDAVRDEQQQARFVRGAADVKLDRRLARAPHDEHIRVGLRPLEGHAAAVRAALAGIGATIEGEMDGVIYASALAAEWDGVRYSPVIADMTDVPRPRNLAMTMAADLGQRAITTAHSLGTGTGFTVAVWEMESCVNRTHPDFRSVTWLARPGGFQCDARGGNFGGIFGHSTAVAGVLAADRGEKGTAGLFRGKLVEIDALNPAAVDAMWALNPQIVNASFTLTSFDSERIDREVYARKAFVFYGAGNEPQWESQCEPYNALCVGGYTNVGGQYVDDGPIGSYINDSRSHREGPEVVGPWNAARVASYWAEGYGPAQGTSFATPAVAGTAGLLLATHPFVLWQRPALMRAVLMASAQAHPVRDPQSGKRIPNFSDGYDDRVGVGAPNGDRANRIIANGMYRFDPAFVPSKLGALATIATPANYRLRVVMTWDQCPEYNTFDPSLNADFDMIIAGPVPASLLIRREYHSNLSDVDNYEVIEVVPQVSTNYTVNVSAPRWASCRAEGGQQRARLAVAWTLEPTSAGAVSQ